MAEDRIYLTVAREKRKPQNDGYVALITQGQPQFGDDNIVVLTVGIVKNMKAAKAWFKQMVVEQPWMARS